MKSKSILITFSKNNDQKSSKQLKMIKKDLYSASEMRIVVYIERWKEVKKAF